ncbi:bifunctional UDP-N-acetylglucosamine diphosphorylase/glucosamine-1-phosphate N-acetyltransferase GlmU [Cucumibacter marinus]|uniref:bifunctional UDP-N-acetylglucosamine diphosphorylase/glucosamine-1-phosphate N-acetyltransferase GlmU n=1 Tax=Cucumibacter marinus TaxID=1121252 RepID=UPI00040CB4B1|nr:bifunctional UDP-N-acetylglucosamine diphosphorylase/glucosamine-1-phosphate N-acetyltransferase GlmU [Cucumibacter marinus]
MADLLAIILAAGEGKRMKSDTPKLLHRVGGMPIIGHVLAAARGSGATELAVVTAPGADAFETVIRQIAPDAGIFVQDEAKGTAHAAMAAREAFDRAKGNVIVVYGDHPLLRPENLDSVIAPLDAGKHAAILGFKPESPTGYGRLITEGDRLLAIREEKDASEEERRIGLCNACGLAFRADVFRDLIDKVTDDNAQGEFYITDLVELANAEGLDVGYAIAPEADVVGVNSRGQLAVAEKLFQKRRRAEMMDAGVTLIDPDTVYFSYDTAIERDVEIEPGVWFGPGVSVSKGASIKAWSHLEGCTIGPGAEIGPFARLRPAAEIGEGAKVGNFVEVKKAKVGKGAKLNHLSYIGDAQVGAAANIGAGTITCNYDGFNKWLTVIGEGAFIGSNSSLVAPVNIGDGAYVGSGSVITQNVEADALALARGQQVNKPGRGADLRARNKAIKDQRKNDKA